MNILKRPIITERSTLAAKKGFYTFAVVKNARKEQIKKAIEDQFGINVVSIRTIKMPEKTKRSSKTGRTSTSGEWKKAIVKVKTGEKITLFEVGS